MVHARLLYDTNSLIWNKGTRQNKGERGILDTCKILKNAQGPWYRSGKKSSGICNEK